MDVPVEPPPRQRSLSPKRGAQGRLTKRSSSRRLVLRGGELQQVVRVPSRRLILLGQRANSAPNLASLIAKVAVTATTSTSDKHATTNTNSRPPLGRKSASDQWHRRPRDNSLFNARQPRRNTGTNGSSSGSSRPQSRWQDFQQVQPRMGDATAPSRMDCINVASSNSPPLRDSVPFRPRRSRSPVREKDKDKPKRPPQRTYDDSGSDSSSDSDGSDDDDHTTPESTNHQPAIESRKKLDATLLGCVDLEETDANHDLYVPESVPSTKSTNAASRLFQAHRSSTGKKLPPRSSSGVQSRNSSENQERPMRRIRSMDMQVHVFKNNRINNSSPRNSSHSRRNPRGATNRATTNPTITASPPRHIMQSVVSVILGSRNTKSFHLRRNSIHDDPARQRLKQRRCRSMDITPTLVKRSASPPPSPQGRTWISQESGNLDNDDVTHCSPMSCDVSHVMASLTREEDIDMSFFTHDSSSGGSNTRRGSLATLSSFPSAANDSHKTPTNDGVKCHSRRQSPKGRSWANSPGTSTPNSLSPFRGPSHRKPPTNIADLVENMKDHEEGEYVIFIGDEHDLANAKGSMIDDDGDDNSNLSIGMAGSMCSLGYRSRRDDDEDKASSHGSLGYRNPDVPDYKIQVVLPGSHVGEQQEQGSVHDNDDDTYSDVDIAEEWSESENSSSSSSNNDSETEVNALCTIGDSNSGADDDANAPNDNQGNNDGCLEDQHAEDDEGQHIDQRSVDKNADENGNLVPDPTMSNLHQKTVVCPARVGGKAETTELIFLAA
jgi:hypothetical protein